MKDILFEKHRNIIFDNVRGDVSEIKYAAVACADTTKEIAKGFAEWVYENYKRNDSGYISHDSIRNGDYLQISNFNTIEQLLEKYLETLNQK